MQMLTYPECAKNMIKKNVVLGSALAECFLKKMRKDGYIRYKEGSEFFDTAEDDEENPQEDRPKLKPLDDKIKNRLEKVRDLVLFRYGSTGVTDAINRAVEIKNLIPVYPVKNIRSFTCDGSKGIFRDCMLVHPGTTVRELCKLLSGEMDKHFLFAEGVNGQRLGEDEEITKDNNIIKFTTASTENVTHKDPIKQEKKPSTTKKKEKEEETQD